MARHPKPPASPSLSPPPCPPSESDPGIGFDPIEEWLVDFDPAMSSELAAKGLGPAEQAAAVPHTLVETAAEKSSELEFGVKDGKVEVVSGGGLDGLLAPDQLLVSGIGNLDVREDIPEGEGAVAMEMAAARPAPADAEMNTTVCVEVESEGGKEGQEAPPAPSDAEMMNTTVSAEVQPEGGKERLESSDEESESESSENDDDSSSTEASSSSEEEKEQGVHKDEESSEASSSEEEELGVKRHGGKADNLETLLEEGELMIRSNEEDEEQKGGIKSKYEAEVLPPVPKIEIQLEPHHQTLPVGTISAIMGERVIVEGSVQHNPLNEGSILWITERRTPLGIVDELFGPVKNPYYLVRYNSEEEVPAGISARINVSFVAEFADHILNMKELYAKGYDESDPVDNDEEEDLPDFSDDEKEAEYKRSLCQAKRQTDRQHEPMKTSRDRKRSQSRGSGIRKPVPPRNLDTSTPGHQPRPHFHRSDMAPAGAENTARSLGPQNAPMFAPTMLPCGPMNPSVPSPVPLANQMGGCFMNPAQQQFLPQQPNMVWPGGFPQPPHPNMGVDGAALAANIMQNLLAGANQFQQQFQNPNFSGAGANQFPQQFQNQNFSGPGANEFQQQFQNQKFGGFPNQMPMPFPQFMHQTGMPANPMPFGGRPPVNSPFGPTPQVPMGQGNFGQPPNSQGFTNLAPPRGDGKQDSPSQFSSRQFHQGSPSFGRGRTQQRGGGGRHSSGRGGRGGRHRR
ncbi:LOW QUALITY PROTEIN: uncharacterized protein [Miscanthus floridulus]|uniref:LOW QUALITY PROTEIN: uncharacterized protein n=1 Tax=Miscanthus floridulus TaxID=154761 RepID=UPI003458115A